MQKPIFIFILFVIIYSCSKVESTPEVTPPVVTPPVVTKLSGCDSIKQGLLKTTTDTIRLVSCLSITGCDSVRLGILKPNRQDTLRLLSCIKISGCDSLRLGILKANKQDTIRLLSCFALPIISTTAATEISISSVMTGGNITSDGGSPIISRGVLWGLSNNLNISLNTKTSDGTGIGKFASKIENLSSAVKYYVRSYATNVVGTSYGEEFVFTTSIISGNSIIGTIVGANGRIWLDRNLGAERVALGIDDINSFGELYQWGRGKDGHQLRTSNTTSILSTSDVPGNGLFIIPSNFSDWRVIQNDKLWQGVNGLNNVCPIGFRLPTEAEWNTELSSWSSKDAAGAFASSLKLPMSGRRGSEEISYALSGYWSSTVSGTNSIRLAFAKSASLSGSTQNPWVQAATRAWGFSVRCIKD